MRLAVVCFACALAVSGAEFSDRLTQSYAARPGGKLVFESEYGSIQVITGDVQNIGLELERKVDTDSKQEADRIFQDLDIQQTEAAGETRIQARFKTGWKPKDEVRGRARRICHDDKCLEYASQLREQRYRLTIPRQFNVDLQTRGGSVAVADLQGSARARTSGGSLTFGQIQGPVSGATSGGNIRLQGTTGTAEVKTSGGSIHIGSVEGQVEAATSGGSITIEHAKAAVRARTSGGPIEIREVSGAVDAKTSGGSVRAILTRQPEAPCTLATSGGSITVALPPNAGVDVDAVTSGGGVSTEFPITVQGEINKHSLKTKINGGGPLLTLRTSGGSIRLQKSTI
jgi:hypothetical protein